MASVSTILFQIQQVNASLDADAAAQSSKNELSTMILDKYKQRVFKYLLHNKTITDAISNSTIPVSIVVGVISPNGIKFQDMVIFPKLIIQGLMEI